VAATVKLPKWGLTMEEGTIVEWMFEPGEEVAQGDTLATVESEKAEMELPSPAAGILARYLVEEGETVAVGSELALIAADRAEYESLSTGSGRRASE
jgi:pyruvate/2-oxoglutarate dehydrogenase complex dihydrolipoamide acyltransferase (E2) component